MIIKNKRTGEMLVLHGGAYEVSDAFIVPLQCYYKEDYELVEHKPIEMTKDGFMS